MSLLVSMVMVALPKALMGIAAKLLTEKALQEVLEKVLIYGLEKAAKISTNSIDDEVVADIKKRLAEPSEPAPGA